MEVLPDGWHFIPKHLEKNIKYYRHILIQEGSAKIEDIMNKGDPSIVLYHKFIITGFISSKDWGQHPALLRTLKGLKTFTGSDLHYSYYDSMDAFEKVLFFQNKKFDHSWFIMFDKKFHDQIPSWFIKWWEMFGPVPQTWPEPLQDCLGEFSVKWWDSLNIDPIINQIHKDYPPPVQRNIAPVTRSQSSLDSVQIAGKSSKELKDLAQLLLLQSEELQSQEKATCVLTKTNWTKDDTKEVVRSSHPPLVAITFKYKNQDVSATPFRFPSGEEKLVKKVIEKNNYTNQCLNVIGKQLDRPTPPDLQYEEKNVSNQFSVSSGKLYEWNINGLSEQEILKKIQHIAMVANNYLNEGKSHSKVIDLMVLGFTGKLLQWWNNCLTEESKDNIRNVVQKDEEGLPIFEDPLRRRIPDGVNTLIYTIINHFIGEPSNITFRIYDQLRDYKWYEDVFTTRVMHRSDCNSPFWKEKFINGLPRLFGEKVKETLCNLVGVIDYDSLTYGDISSTIRSEGRKMCRDFKIQSQANKSKVKYEVGTFCTQYGLPPIAPSKRKSRRKESLEKPYRKRTTAKFYRKKEYSNPKDNDFYKKGKSSKSKSTGKLTEQPFARHEGESSMGNHGDSISLQKFAQVGYSSSHEMHEGASSNPEAISLQEYATVAHSSGNIVISLQETATMEAYFGSSLRVYERARHPFPGLLINYSDLSEDEEEDNQMNPHWLSQMFKYSFVRFMRLTSHNQVSQFPAIIKDTITKTKTPFVSIRCWSTLPEWEMDEWAIVQPSKHLVIIGGYSHQGPWLEGNTFLSYNNPKALSECWRHFFSNEIIKVTKELWRNYHFIGNTGRISVFSTRPYYESTPQLPWVHNCYPRRFMIPGTNPIYEPLIYCGLCEQFTTFHEHACNNDPP
ncbi:hypothetical protein SO802_021485 [Lithocarpus litseifolius]|uniref:DUF7746 domain-containing protein n=1 Tax=Lithocarpus litseifolius TaxID=425828 RepID=A0AAW2CJD8_9ROSI